MALRLVTWNINSIRLRLESLAQLVHITHPDILCLQETKVVDAQFPLEAVQSLGFDHVLFWGIKGYNGTAILSRLPLSQEQRRLWCDREDARHLVTRITCDSAIDLPSIELHNFYVPAGGDTPDPDTNDKFAHKLAFLKEMAAWFAAADPSLPRLLVGDLNVAPLETDVWSHKQLLNVVSHTPIEVDHLRHVFGSLDWVDAIRHLLGDEEKIFTWWSYRARDWEKSDRGRRLDHIWLTKNLQPYLRSATVLKEVRGWDKPSDHAPVLADFSS